MPETDDFCGSAIKNGLAVLMARIVSGAGEHVQRSEIASITFSIYQLDPCRPEHPSVVPGHEAVSLDVSDVIFNSLETGGLWTIDEEGYNFRHEIDVGRPEAFPKTGVQYEVSYALTPVAGQKTIVRFQLRVN